MIHEDRDPTYRPPLAPGEQQDVIGVAEIRVRSPIQERPDPRRWNRIGQVVGAELRRQVKDFVRAVNLDTCEHLTEIVRGCEDGNADEAAFTPRVVEAVHRSDRRLGLIGNRLLLDLTRAVAPGPDASSGSHGRRATTAALVSTFQLGPAATSTAPARPKARTTPPTAARAVRSRWRSSLVTCPFQFSAKARLTVTVCLSPTAMSVPSWSPKMSSSTTEPPAICRAFQTPWNIATNCPPEPTAKTPSSPLD